MFKRYALYLIRWQLSTPILAPIIALVKGSSSIFGTAEEWLAASIANLIGGLIFFWVDKLIFTSKLGSIWHVEENIICVDCNQPAARGYRLVKSINYDRSKADSKYRCEACSIAKANRLKQNGVELYR
jgi:hypothetical protein